MTWCFASSKTNIAVGGDYGNGRDDDHGLLRIILKLPLSGQLIISGDVDFSARRFTKVYSCVFVCFSIGMKEGSFLTYHVGYSG